MTISTTAPERNIDSAEAELRTLISNVGWQGYLTLLDQYEGNGTRLYYLDGTVELMTVGFSHERPKKLLGRMVEALTEELDIETMSVGSSTLKREGVDRGAEPDEAYYLANVDKMGRRMTIDLEVTPPPDLVIEVEITSPLLDKLAIYAGLGVPEIWRHDGQNLTVMLLQPDTAYANSSQSRVFPFLPMDAFAGQLRAYDLTHETRWIKAFRAWVREVVIPLYRP